MARKSAVLISLLLAPLAFAVESDFNFYEKDAQECLYKAQASSKCSPAKDYPTLNSCLCSNEGDFVTNSAKCLADAVSEDIGKKTYSDMSEACSNSQTPLTVSEDDWNELLAGGKDSPSSTTSSSSSKTSSPATKTGNKDDNKDDSSNKDDSKDESKNDNTDKNSEEKDDGPPMGAIIGGAIGGAAVLLAAAGTAFWFFRRRRNNTEEAHPMLPPSETQYQPTIPVVSPLTPGPGAAYEKDQKSGRFSTVSAYSPAPTASTPHSAQWGGGMTPSPSPGWNGSQQPSPYNNSAYPPPPAQIAELPPQGNAMVFEMDGSESAGPRGHVAELDSGRQ